MTKRELSWKEYFLFHKDRCLKMSLPGETMSTWRLEMRAGVEPTPDWQHSLCEVPIRFASNTEKWYFSVSFDNIHEVLNCPLKVFENGSGEDLAVFCRSVISYCGKRGVEVKETMIRQKKTRQKWPKLTLFRRYLDEKRNLSQSAESVQLSWRDVKFVENLGIPV